MSEVTANKDQHGPPLGADMIAMLPRWQSHKIVRAAKITQVFSDDVMELDLDDPKTGLCMCVTPAEKMFARYRPVAGDYYVVYDDGYASISPRAAFEEGYHKL